MTHSRRNFLKTLGVTPSAAAVVHLIDGPFSKDAFWTTVEKRFRPSPPRDVSRAKCFFWTISP